MDLPIATAAEAQETVSPAAVVAAEARHRIRDHLGRQARYNPTASLKALTTQLKQEYEDRFPRAQATRAAVQR